MINGFFKSGKFWNKKLRFIEQNHDLGLGQTSNLKSRRIHLNRRDKESTSFQLGSKRRTYFNSWLH